MTPDMSYYWEGARDRARINGMNKYILQRYTHSIPTLFGEFLVFICPFFSTQRLVTDYFFFCAVVHPERRY